MKHCLHSVSVSTERTSTKLQWMIKNFPQLSSRQKAPLTFKTEPKPELLLDDIKACGRKRDLSWGRSIHAKATEFQSCYNDVHVLTALIQMYAQCSSMLDASHVFDNIQEPDLVSRNVLLQGYVENGNGLAALEVFSFMKETRCMPNSKTYVAALKACISLVNEDGNGKQNCLERVREIHLEIDCHIDHYVQNTLIDMYSKCGCMVEANRVFKGIQNPSVVSWTALLMGYAVNGEGQTALDLFLRMKDLKCTPDSVTYVAVLKACTSLALSGSANGRAACLQRGKEIHLEIGSNLNLYVQNMLIDMYSKCGSMVEARRVFDGIRKPSVVSWTSLLLGYAENGEGVRALELFSKMKASGYSPDSLTYVAALKACTSLALNGEKYCLEQGRIVHSEMHVNLDCYVQNTLIDMYAKCGSMVDARSVFDSIENPNVVSWTALILGYAENGQELVAMETFSLMKSNGCTPNAVTYVAALKACSLMGSLDLGRKLHLEMTEFTSHIVTCLVDFYAKCGSIIEAREVFDAYPRVRDVSTWNALLAGYGGLENDSVFALFEKMQGEGLQPNAVTFACMLLCCTHAGLVEKAKEYFQIMPLKYGVTPDLNHYNAMVDILARADQLKEALFIVRDMTCHTDVITWTPILGACQKLKNFEMGRLAFMALIDIDRRNPSAYILMANIYGSRGMWEAQKNVLEEQILRLSGTVT